MRRKRDIVDHPLITARQAAVFFHCSHDRFKEKFDKVLYKEIAVGKTTNSRGYLLTDVLRAAFPQASNHTIHVLAMEVCYKHAAERKASTAERKATRARRAKQERGKDE